MSDLPSSLKGLVVMVLVLCPSSSRRRGGLVVERQTLEREVGGSFDPHSRRRVVSLSKIHLPPKKHW